MTNTTTTVTPVVAPVWGKTGKSHYTWFSPVGPVVVFKEGSYWYHETPTHKVARRAGRDRRPMHYSGITTAEGAKSLARNQVCYEIERAVKAHTPTPAFPFVVGQRVECHFGTATVVRADQAGWIELLWDDGECTDDKFDASEFNPA